MTPDEFHKLALRLPETVEQQHQGHPDFRVGGKVFATLGWPDTAWGMVKLPIEEQKTRVAIQPEYSNQRLARGDSEEARK